ncbi:MAG TPA: hypothetical protein VK191_10670 [Symbiobacteriaceae bacterium]|nr:hypothetical protein [Symbiobacteriaceae bacterium]
MSRILVDPNQLQSLASQFEAIAASLQEIGRRSSQSLVQTDWVSQSLQQTEGQIEAVARLGAGLANEALELGVSLRQTADRFLAANAWRPSRSVGGGGAVGTTAPVMGAAPVAPSPGAPFQATPADSMAVLNAHFPDPQRQAVLAHIVKVEGMGGPSAAHGGVVYAGDDGLRSDRQWLNFGYISFAMPSGTGGDVLRRIFATPGEEEAFRAIALRHLQDQAASQVPASHSHLLREAGTEIPALSATAQTDQFIALVKAGKDPALADWFFKYGNTPAVEREVATGDLRPEWKAIMDEFLGRPASVQAQLEQIDNGYLSPAIESAKEFGVQSEKAVAWFADQHVQSGAPNADMYAMIEPSAPPAGSRLSSYWQRYQAGDETERLQVLTELSGSPGTTVRGRREAVLANPALTGAPFKGI